VPVRNIIRKDLKLLKVNRDTDLLTTLNFPILKDSDIAATKDDQALLDANLIEAGQDDDVDTDEEIMENALNSCFTDLYRAERQITRSDGTIAFPRLRNYTIKLRTDRPDFYDRNGMYREPRFLPKR